MRVGLVSCCKKKLDHAAPAKDLYQSPLFRLSVRWLNHPGRVAAWGILSAKHGLVLPDQVLEPYDLCLHKLGSRARKQWEEQTRQQIIQQWGSDTIYMVLMGAHYRAALDGLMVEDPIYCWTQWRIDKGMTRRRAAMGIGMIMNALKDNKPYY